MNLYDQIARYKISSVLHKEYLFKILNSGYHTFLVFITTFSIFYIFFSIKEFNIIKIIIDFFINFIYQLMDPFQF